MSVGVIGGGAFGTALAEVIARDDRPSLIWARNAESVVAINTRSENPRYLPEVPLSQNLRATGNLTELVDCSVILLCLPMQKLGGFLEENSEFLDGKPVVACCKGVDLSSLAGPTTLISNHISGSAPAVLSGPSFARDIALGLPTALTLACSDAAIGSTLQTQLSTSTLRLYLSDDPVGTELGGALKNVIAIACGIAMGAGLGESARAAIMTRGFSEMQRFAVTLGADASTLYGLSGFGDLALTCTSEQSRNYRYGLALGAGKTPDVAVTTEGVHTAKAVSILADTHGILMPVCDTVAAITNGEVQIAAAISALLSRPLTNE